MGKLHTTKGVAPGLYQIVFVKNLIYRQVGSTEIIGIFIDGAPVQKKSKSYFIIERKTCHNKESSDRSSVLAEGRLEANI